MIGIPHSVRILIGTTPIDMRKSIDGLTAIVQAEMGEDAYSGHLFVFVSRERAEALEIELSQLRAEHAETLNPRIAARDKWQRIEALGGSSASSTASGRPC